MTRLRAQSNGLIQMDNEIQIHPPVVILARPQMGENIGATARAMMNCGLSDYGLWHRVMAGQMRRLCQWRQAQINH